MAGEPRKEEDLLEEIERLRSSLAESNQNAEELQEQLADAVNGAEQMKEQLQRERSGNKEEVQLLRQENDALRNELEHDKKVAQSKLDELKLKVAAIDTMEEENNSMRDRVSQLLGEMERQSRFLLSSVLD